MSNDKEILYERKTIVNIEGCQLPVGLSEAVTLRDQFAIAAMMGLSSGPDNRFPKTLAREAYAIADAMMEARK